jgi:hypothetical protein
VVGDVLVGVVVVHDRMGVARQREHGMGRDVVERDVVEWNELELDLVELDLLEFHELELDLLEHQRMELTR